MLKCSVLVVSNNFPDVPELVQGSDPPLFATIHLQDSSNELKTGSSYGRDKVNSLLGCST
jgi:hypothetical protein